MNEQAEDKITNLPDSLLHYVLSLLDIKEVARTSVLSKRWYCIWISIPTLNLRSLSDPFPPWRINELSYQESSKFMDIVDRMLHAHDMSSIQKLSLLWYYPLNETRVNLWISAAIRHNVEELSLILYLNSTFFTPLSLCTCESLVTLELDIFPNLYLPKYMSFPKLKRLKLSQVKFSDKYNNEQFFSSCPVLENLTLLKCEWFDMKYFCLSTPSLKVLEIRSLDLDNILKNYGFRNCTFEIQAPNLVSLTYWGDLAKEYVISNFLALVEVNVYFCFEELLPFATNNRCINQGVNLSKFFQALSHVKRLSISDRSLQVLSFTHDLTNNLPTFQNLKILSMDHNATNYKALIALLQSAPNLETLVFSGVGTQDKKDPEEEKDDNDPYHYGDGWGLDLNRCLFPQLKSVCFEYFECHPSEKRWVELILEQATALEEMTFPYSSEDEIRDNMDLTSLPRASASCVFIFD